MQTENSSNVLAALSPRCARALHVGAANSRLDYLLGVKGLLGDFGIRSSLRRTNRAGTSMTIRGKTWTRRYDVYHVVITGYELVKRFNQVVGFRNATKAQKLKDLVTMIRMSSDERFVWFQARYERKGRKWVRIDE